MNPYSKNRKIFLPKIIFNEIAGAILPLCEQKFDRCEANLVLLTAEVHID